MRRLIRITAVTIGAGAGLMLLQTAASAAPQVGLVSDRRLKFVITQLSSKA